MGYNILILLRFCLTRQPVAFAIQYAGPSSDFTTLGRNPKMPPFVRQFNFENIDRYSMCKPTSNQPRLDSIHHGAARTSDSQRASRSIEARISLRPQQKRKMIVMRRIESGHDPCGAGAASLRPPHHSSPRPFFSSSCSAALKQSPRVGGDRPVNPISLSFRTHQGETFNALV